MSDLVFRLDDAASLIKHSDNLDPEHLDRVRGLLKEASYKLGVLGELLAPMSFSYELGLDGYLVKLEAEVPREGLASLLQIFCDNLELRRGKMRSCLGDILVTLTGLGLIALAVYADIEHRLLYWVLAGAGLILWTLMVRKIPNKRLK